jgi:hypothetical protein
MAGIQDFVEYADDFLGHGELPAAQSDSDWLIDDTSSAGTPTYTKGGIGGEATLAFDSQAEIQNVCLHMGDDLNFDIDDLDGVYFRVKMGQAAMDATSMVAFGVCSARNDAIDSLAAHASFRVIGADSTTALVVESDDGTNDNDDVATGTTLINAYKRFYIDFSGGTADVKFYVDGVRVASATTFDMSNYTAGLQPYVQIQKTADANTDSVVVDYVKLVSRR